MQSKTFNYRRKEILEWDGITVDFWQELSEPITLTAKKSFQGEGIEGNLLKGLILKGLIKPILKQINCSLLSN